MDKDDVKELATATVSIAAINKDISEIKTTLDKLPENLVKQLDERYATAKEVAELKETVAPLTEMRRALWKWAVGAVVVLFVYMQFAKDKIGSLLQ